MGAYDNEVVNLFSLTIRDEDVVSKVDTIIEIIQKLGLTTQEAMNAVREALVNGFLSFGEYNEAWKKLDAIADASSQQIEESAQRVGESAQGMVEQFDEALGTGGLSLEELAQKWAELSPAASESAQQVEEATQTIGESEQQMAEETTAATEQVVEANQAMAASVENATTQLITSAEEYLQELQAVGEAQQQVTVTVDAVANALANAAIAMVENTQAALDLAEKQMEAAQAAADMAAAEGLDADTLAALAERIDQTVAAYAKLIGANAELYAAVQDEANALANSAINLVEAAQVTLDLAAAKARAAQAAYDMAAAEGMDNDVLTLLQQRAQAAAAALDKLAASQKSTADAMNLTGESAQSEADIIDSTAAVKMQAIQEETQVVSDYMSMLDSLGGAGEAATAGMFSLDQAIGDATTTYNELDDASATAAYDVQAVGNEAETAGEKVSTANEGFGASQYILFQLGFMALSAAQQFFTLGVNAQDALTIIQGKTGASDAQMQQWTDTLEQMGLKGGYSLDVMAQGLDIVTQAQFKGADATNVLQYAMELARASGSKLTDSTNLLAMSMDAFGAKASDAHTYAAILFDALSNGKQNIQELTNALGPVVGEAAQAGIGFEDLVSAETDFSRSSSNSMEATRGFQGLIQALSGDAQMTTDQIVKLGLAFDQTKFQTLDFAGKLEFLAKYTDGNVQEFTQLIGGMKDAKDAMSTLDISTHQLAVNADTLGLSFDPVRYNAMDAADKLYYLLQVSGNNEAEFKKLTTGGVNPLNDALLQLSLSTNDVADRAKQMGLNFDEAKFKTDDLQHKLLDLWDASGHNIDAFAKLIGGSKDVGAAFGIMGLNADGTSKKQDNLGQHADDLGNKHLSANSPVQQHMSSLQKHLSDLNDDLDKNDQHIQTTTDKVKHLDDAYSKTGDDMKANSGKFNAGLSDFAKSFADLVGPSLGGALRQLGSAFEWLSHNMWLFQGASMGAESSDGLFVQSLSAVVQALIDAAKWVWNLGVTVGNFVNTVPKLFSQMWDAIKQAFTSGSQSVQDDINYLINWLISKFTGLHVTLVGNSIIPDMIDAITNVFRNAGPTWESAIQGDINGILSRFTSLPGQLYTSAVHAVQQFVAGLLSQIGNVENAASQIAAKVASFLHHSKPDVGPMADDDQWMPDFMEMLATGMEANISRLTHASSQVAQSLIPPVGYGTSPLGSQQSITPIVTLLTQILSVLQSQRGGQGGTPPSVTMNNVFAGGGSSSVGQLYSQLDQMAGIRFEAGLRGAL